ncbi:MAG: pimeloyl-ACP methyl ester carboxylesterase [Candidatus Aldehydirespiratoraceae bacterium]|jgi:pimeloyl-ACP methyl ester carboxylesterase
MPFRREMVSSDDRRVSYLVEGVGPALILIPGVFYSAATWVRSGYFDRFASSYQVIAIDHPGHGEIAGPTDPAAYSAELLVSDVIAVIEHEKAAEACVWGYAGGAEIAALVARRRPNLVCGLIFAGAFLGDVAEALDGIGIDLESATERCAVALENGDWEGFFDMVVGDTPPEVRAEIRGNKNGPVVAARVRATMTRPRAFLKPPAPTLAYWADQEVFATANSRLAESMPLETGVVPGSGFDGFRLVDQVAPMVERFLGSLVRV